MSSTRSPGRANEAATMNVDRERDAVDHHVPSASHGHIVDCERHRAARARRYFDRASHGATVSNANAPSAIIAIAPAAPSTARQTTAIAATTIAPTTTRAATVGESSYTSIARAS